MEGNDFKFRPNGSSNFAIMTNKGVAIKYGDVAPGAKESFVAESSEKAFDTLGQLQETLSFPNYGNPCELYSVVLDGSAVALPSDPEEANIGLWSNQISGADGTFAESIVLTLESEGQYSSQGLTFTFDTYNNIYPTRMRIQWIRTTTEGIETLDVEEFQPNNAFYFCQNKVENFNKIVIIFYSLNMPYNRLKLRVIDYGYGTIFVGDELRNTQLQQSIDVLSSEIKINTCNLVLDSKRNIEYSFQEKQPLSIYFNGALKATMFVKSSTRQSQYMWNVTSEDYIGLMDGIPFYGDVYTKKNAYELFEEIFSVAKIPHQIDNSLKDVILSGYIPVTTCREALMHVAFATQSIINTAETDIVEVNCKNEINNNLKLIPRSRIMQGMSFVEETTVTAVKVASHTYEPSEKTAENAIIAYNAKDDGVGNNILVLFSEPLHSLYSLNEGEIIESSANYAIVNAVAGNFRLIGYTYNHTTQTKTKRREDVSALQSDNVVSIEQATMVTAINIDAVLDSCFSWLTKTAQTNLKIIEGKHVEEGQRITWGQKKWGAFKWGEKTPDIITYDTPVRLGDYINVETEYMGVKNGTIISQNYNLNGNIIVKEVALK